jgi:hypothetical protein
LDLRRNAVMVLRDELQLGMMEVNKRVVMCNAAAAQRFCTHGNNAVLLRQFLPTPLYCGNGRVWMTGDSHYFSEEEDDTTQAP